jgi:thiamine-phosphate pyrophosphorylase
MMAQKKVRLSPSIKVATIQGLYALTPDSTDTENLLRRVRQALSGGVRVLQYRNKIVSDDMRLQQAIALREITRAAGVTFIVNDDAHLAAKVDADGVHLGAADGDIKTARALLGTTKLIGVSCYNQIELARNAVQAGADYVAFGAFYSSSVKPNAAVATLDLLRVARAEIDVPIVAGVDAIAVISAVFEAADIQLAAQNVTKLFRNKTA